MKHLLVPVDFSEYAYNACLHAMHLASINKARITLFHVFHIPVIDPVMPVEELSTLSETAEKDVRAALEKLVSQLNQYTDAKGLGKIEISIHSTLGFAVDEILIAAKKHKADIVVMGRRFTEGMAKILLGSITSAIVEKAEIPVLVVPENVQPEKAMSDILYASELDEADKRTLAKLLDFAKPLGAKIHCIHIDIAGQGETASKAKMAELAKTYAAEQAAKHLLFKNILSVNVTDALLDYVGENHVSLMAMLTHKRSFFTKLFDSSLTKKIAFRTNIPLLVYHEKE